MKTFFTKYRAIAVIMLVVNLFLVTLSGNTQITSANSGNWSSANTWTNTNTNRTGTVTTLTSSTTVTGSGTLFLTELSVGSVITTQAGTALGTVLSIASNTSLTLTANASNAVTGQSYRTTDGPPSPVDAVTITSGDDVTVNGTFTCASLLINTANAIADLSFATTGNPSLTVTGAVTVGNSGNANREGRITFESGSTLIAGSLSLGAVATQTSSIIMTNGGLLKVGSLSVFSGSTWTPGTGTVEMTATNTIPATIFTTFNNL